MSTLESILTGIVIGLVSSMWTTSFALNARIATIERRITQIAQSLGVEMGPPTLSDRVKLLAADPSQKIAAIKAYREETGMGLKESKDAVEAYIRGELS